MLRGGRKRVKRKWCCADHKEKTQEKHKQANAKQKERKKKKKSTHKKSSEPYSSFVLMFFCSDPIFKKPTGMEGERQTDRHTHRQTIAGEQIDVHSTTTFKIKCEQKIRI